MSKSLRKKGFRQDDGFNAKTIEVEPETVSKVNWSSFITVFNEIHNPDLKTMVGDVNVKATKKK